MLKHRSIEVNKSQLWENHLWRQNPFVLTRSWFHTLVRGLSFRRVSKYENPELRWVSYFSPTLHMIIDLHVVSLSPISTISQPHLGHPCLTGLHGPKLPMDSKYNKSKARLKEWLLQLVGGGWYLVIWCDWFNWFLLTPTQYISTLAAILRSVKQWTYAA